MPEGVHVDYPHGLTEDMRRERRCRAALHLPMLQDELDEIEREQKKEMRVLERNLMAAGCTRDELEEATDEMGSEDWAGIIRLYQRALRELLGLPAQEVEPGQTAGRA